MDVSTMYIQIYKSESVYELHFHAEMTGWILMKLSAQIDYI